MSVHAHACKSITHYRGNDRAGIYSRIQRFMQLSPCVEKCLYLSVYVMNAEWVDIVRPSPVRAHVLDSKPAARRALLLSGRGHSRALYVFGKGLTRLPARSALDAFLWAYALAFAPPRTLLASVGAVERVRPLALGNVAAANNADRAPWQIPCSQPSERERCAGRLAHERFVLPENLRVTTCPLAALVATKTSVGTLAPERAFANPTTPVRRDREHARAHVTRRYRIR